MLLKELSAQITQSHSRICCYTLPKHAFVNVKCGIVICFAYALVGVVGAKEEEEGVVSVRSRFLGDEGQQSLDTFVDHICKEIRTKEIRKIEVEENK